MSPRPLAVLSLALLRAGFAAASIDTATVDVRVTPPARSGEPAAVVRLRAMRFAWSTEVEERHGRAVAARVPPGRYELIVERTGLAIVSRELSLDAGAVLVVQAVLGPSSSSLRVADRDQPAEGTAFGQAMLMDLPSGRDPWSLLETAEPVAIADRMDTGGVWAGVPGRVTAHGASLRQASLHLGAADLTDPAGTGFGLVDPDLSWISDLRLATATLPVDAEGAGPLVVAVPRRPPVSWSASAEADRAFPEAGQGSATRSSAIARLECWRLGTFVAGGPLRRDTLGLLVAGSLKQAARIEQGDAVSLPAQVASGLAHLVWTPRQGQEGRLFLLGQAAERPFAGRQRFGSSDRATPEEVAFAHAQAEWQSRRRSGAVTAFSAAFGKGVFDSPERAYTFITEINRVRDGPVPELPLPGRRVRQRGQTELRLEAPASLLGLPHLLQLGASLAREAATTRLLPGVHVRREKVFDAAARVWEYASSGDEDRWSATSAAAWAADRIRLSDRLSIDGGVRLEWLRGSAAQGDAVRWLTLSPRVRARWRFGGSWSFLGAYGRYAHRLPLSMLAWGDSAAPVWTVYRWDDRDGDIPWDAGERGDLVARVGPGAPVGRLDPDLRRPHTDEVLLGVESRPGAWTVRLVGVRRRERDLIESINVGVPPVIGPSYRALFVPDPGGDLHSPDDDQLLQVADRLPVSFGADRFVVTNPQPGHNALHEGVELTLARRGERLELLLGATAHRSSGPGASRGFRPDENDQGVIGEHFDDPNADTNDRGRLFSDRAYTIKIAGRYAAPGQVRLGLVARYQDGQPFARLVVAPGLGQGADAVRAVPNGRHRFAFAITVDGRLEKGLTLGRARLVAMAEGFNLLGNTHEVEENVVTGPAFRGVTAVQPPRVFRLGLRFEL